MATKLYITEFTYLGQVGPSNSPAQLPIAAPYTGQINAEQMLSVQVGSTASASFNAATAFIMVNCDGACSLAFGTAPIAVVTAHRMGANETRFYAVPVGQNWQIAAIANT